MKRFLLISVAGILLKGCIAPNNLQFENAATLPKGNVEVTGSMSYYSYIDPQWLDPEIVGTSSLGLSARIGMTDGYNLNLRFEYRPDGGYSIFEVDNKVRLSGKHLSLSMPFQYYYNSFRSSKYNGQNWHICPDCKNHVWGIAPRLNFSLFNKSESFDFTVMPKMFLLFEYGIFPGLFPGLSLGAGFKNKERTLSIRPEVGYTLNLSGFGTSAGIAVSYKFQ